MVADRFSNWSDLYRLIFLKVVHRHEIMAKLLCLESAVNCVNCQLAQFDDHD